jgi:hypothetical protein
MNPKFILIPFFYFTLLVITWDRKMIITALLTTGTNSMGTGKIFTSIANTIITMSILIGYLKNPPKINDMVFGRI